MTKEEIIKTIIEKNIDNANVLAYFYNKVCVGIYENEDIIFNQEVNYELLTQIRIFNETKEIRFVLDEESQEFIFSEVEDSEIDKEKVIEEYMFVSGNEIVSSNERFTTVTQLGRVVDIPLKLTEEEVKKGVRLVVRNYFEENENKQVVLSDSRLVKFTKEGK